MSNEPKDTPTDKVSEDASTGFAGIGKRINDLRTGNVEDEKEWKQTIAEPSRAREENVKQNATEDVYKPKVDKKKFPSFNLSGTDVSFIIVVLAIIVFFVFPSFKEKNAAGNKQSSEGTPQYFAPSNDESDKKDNVAKKPAALVPQQHPAPSSATINKKKNPATKSSGPMTPTYSTPNSTDQDILTVGQYRCTRSHSNRARELLPTADEKSFIETEQNKLASLKREIETNYVDNYSQESVDRHNALIDNFNARNQRIKRSIDQYNAKITAHNNYLTSNCTKAY